MKKYTFVFLLLTISFAATAQKYRTAAGVRFGGDVFGLSVQQKVLEKSTLEGIFAASSRDASGTLLFEQHFPFLGKAFNYYLGAGAHVGQLKDHGPFFGGDVILGTELKLPLFPLLLSFDIKPAVHVNHEDWFDFASGFTLRYILVKEKKEKKKFGLFGGKEKTSEKKKFKLFGGQQGGEPSRNKNKNRQEKKRLFGL